MKKRASCTAQNQVTGHLSRHPVTKNQVNWTLLLLFLKLTLNEVEFAYYNFKTFKTFSLKVYKF